MNGGTPIAGWFIMENWMIWWYPHFRKPPSVKSRSWWRSAKDLLQQTKASLVQGSKSWDLQNHEKNTLQEMGVSMGFSLRCSKHLCFHIDITQCCDVLWRLYAAMAAMASLITSTRSEARSKSCELQPCSRNISITEICGASRSKYVRKAPARASPRG